MAEDGSQPQDTALMLAPQRGLIDIDQAVAEWEQYQELTKKLLDASDYQRIGDGEFKKKSAWRKYAKAFNISCEQINEEIVRADDGYPVFARVIVRATEPGGRWQDADQECHVTEKCCAEAQGNTCRKRHNHCAQGCTGRQHFSHPGDIPATAFTRAKNRAISDLIGAGEISAEELESGNATPKARKPQVPRADAQPQTTGDQDSAKARYELKKAVEERFKGDEQAAFEYVQEKFPAGCEGTNINYLNIPEAMCAELIEQLPAPAKQGELV